MALSPGTRLGPFEVTAQIGVGGMGEVYRAIDTNLKRQVAIKVLPASVAGDAERLARFQREAEVLAALNHPNIAAIYGLEKSSSTTALVMELVEGPTLADRIAQGAIPLDEALPIAKQIAEALEAAHEQGIIHRDLKPANIKVRPDGTVKVLDFGLAKAMEPSAGSSPSVSQSPTIITPEVTQAGMILGTAAYMSPEQARGKPVDKRADIWAFGCVLYEMLSGRRAFGGEEVTDTLASVITKEPAWIDLPIATPPWILHLLRRCLEKDSRQRLRDIGEARLAMDGAFGSPARSAGPASAPAPHFWQQPVPLALSALLLMVITGLAVWMLTRDPAPWVSRMMISTTGAPLGVQLGDRDVALAPDGSMVIYRGSGQLFVRALNALEPTALSNLGTPRSPFVSPDGLWVGFFDDRRALKKVSVTGGAPVTVCTLDGGGLRGATWGEDGTIVFATNRSESGLFAVSAAGGEAVALTTPDPAKGEEDHLWPEFLPGGRSVLFTIVPLGGIIEHARIAVLDLGNRRYKTLLEDASHAQYMPTGHLLYGRSGVLHAVPFDLDALEVTGATVPLLSDVLMTPSGGVGLDVAGNGTAVYVAGEPVGDTQRSLVWVDRAGRETPLAVPPRVYRDPRISPDGTRVALGVSDGQNDIWIWDLASEALTRLTFEPGNDSSPVWTPDGRKLVFSSTRGGAQSLFSQNADGTGAAERLTDNAAGTQNTAAVSPDGATLVFTQSLEDIMVVGLAPRRAVTPLVQTRFREREADISPDGRWVAYESDESGRFEVYVRPFPNVETGRWQVSMNGGQNPQWSPRGDELFFNGLGDGTLMGVRVEQSPSWRSARPAEVLKGPYYFPTAAGPQFDVSPDGQRFLLIKEIDATETERPREIVVIQNWGEELKRLVPVK